MLEEEDVVENPLFVAIKTRFPGALSQLERRGGIVCAPRTALLRRVRLTQQLIEAHVFLPSPLFVGQFVALNNRTAREDASGVVVSDELGAKRAAVLAQEEVWAGDRGYRVLLVDALLTDDVEREPEPASASAAAAAAASDAAGVRLPTRPTFEKCARFLTETPTNSVVAAKTREQHLRVFNQSYVFVRGFEIHAVNRVRELVQRALEDFVCASPEFRKLYRDSRQYLQLNLVISSFVLGTIHDKVWAGLASCFAAEDAALRAQSLSLAPLSPVSDMGLRQDLLHTIPDAMSIMGRVAECRTPLEMLYRLQDVIDAFSAKADPSALQQQDRGSGGGSGGGGSGDVLSGDDVLPAVVCSVVRAAPDRLHTMLFYMENFVFVDLSVTSLGYALATFRAAIEFIHRTYESLPPDQRLSPSPSASPATTKDDSAIPSSSSSSSSSALQQHQHHQQQQPLPRPGHAKQLSMSSVSLLQPRQQSAFATSPPPSGAFGASRSTAALRAPTAYTGASPPLMQAPPVTATTAPLPGATARAFSRPPEVIKPPSSPANERRLGAFLTKLRATAGDVDSRSFRT